MGERGGTMILYGIRNIYCIYNMKVYMNQLQYAESTNDKQKEILIDHKLKQNLNFRSKC